MSYGKNTELVEEIIAFAKGHGLLNGVVPESPQWSVIRDLAEAKRSAWESPIGDDQLLWSDLRERQMAEIRAATYAQPDFSAIRDALSGNLKTLTVLLRRKLDDHHQDLLDDIIGDLNNCAFNRAVNGANGFFEQLFDAYRAGGWPCGWTGNFPVGRLVVYFPA
jgi:hypothetical protein